MAGSGHPGQGSHDGTGRCVIPHQAGCHGARRRDLPGFLIRLSHGRTLTLEVKGEDRAQNRAKRAAPGLWVRAIDAKGHFGVRVRDIACEPAQIRDILERHAGGQNESRLYEAARHAKVSAVGTASAS